jgi:hypothetical protein
MDHELELAWIDASWLSLEPHWLTKDPLPNDNTARLYQIHQHACKRLTGDPNEFDRVDAIIALRRIVGGRVKALMETYRLRELKTGPKPKYDLELLEHFGIVRPFMLRRLIEVRNIVEHNNDSSPPPVDECLMYADLVWYFLRSTDGLAKVQADALHFPMRRGKFGHLIINFSETFSEPELSAMVYPSCISDKPRKAWLKIECNSIDRHAHDSKVVSTAINGKVRGTEDQMKRIFDVYFRVS